MHVTGIFELGLILIKLILSTKFVYSIFIKREKDTIKV